MNNSIIEITKIFDVTPHDLWDALTNKESLRKWYFNIPNLTTVVGESFDFFDVSGKFLHHCTVLENQKDSCFKYTWEHPNDSKGSSIITWKIIPLTDHKTKLEFTHEGVESFADAGENFAIENYRTGWNELIQLNLRNFLYLIERLHFSININASAVKVWDTLWDIDAYSKWTQPFCYGSYYKGKIEQGGRIHFLLPDGSGMYSDIIHLNPGEKIIFKHLGDIKNNQEQAVDENVMHWTGCIESYRLLEITNSTTEVIIEVDVVNSHLEFMKAKFPMAMDKLKELAEMNK